MGRTIVGEGGSDRIQSGSGEVKFPKSRLSRTTVAGEGGEPGNGKSEKGSLEKVKESQPIFARKGICYMGISMAGRRP